MVLACGNDSVGAVQMLVGTSEQWYKNRLLADYNTETLAVRYVLYCLSEQWKRHVDNGTNSTTAAPITTTGDRLPITTTAAPTSADCTSICILRLCGMTLTQCQQGLTDCVSECGAGSCIGSGPTCGSGQCRCCTDAGCEETSCQNNDATTTTTETRSLLLSTPPVLHPTIRHLTIPVKLVRSVCSTAKIRICLLVRM